MNICLIMYFCIFNDLLTSFSIMVADIYIFDKYGNFWTSKYITRGDDGNN